MARSTDESPGDGASRKAPSSAWAPFRSRDFARMASAQFVSNVGGWMQTVGAQELMLTLTSSATLVALIQSAAGFAGLVTPAILLALIVAVGAGQTLTSPAWQTLQPELVPPQDRPQAIALGSVNQNLSRAVGPAIGGALFAATSAGVLFLINTLSFVPVIGAVARWRGRARPASAAGREHVGPAVRAGGRYVAASPALRVILLRAGLFMLFANSIWALPRLRGRLSVAVLLTGAMLILAVVTLALAYVRAAALAAPVVVVAGVAWILTLSTLNSQYQGTLPGWAKARGMSYYLVVFQGGGALGAALFGVLAQKAGLTDALVLAGVGLVLVAGVGLLVQFKAISPEDLLPAGDWPDPQLVTETEAGGPVLVTVEYRPKHGLESAVVQKLRDGRYARRRTGAVSWRVWINAADPSRVLEQFVVGSWEEHLRQHERVSRRDQERLREITAMTEPTAPPTVTHWLAPPTHRP